MCTRMRMRQINIDSNWMGGLVCVCVCVELLWAHHHFPACMWTCIPRTYTTRERSARGLHSFWMFGCAHPPGMLLLMQKCSRYQFKFTRPAHMLTSIYPYDRNVPYAWGYAWAHATLFHTHTIKRSMRIASSWTLCGLIYILFNWIICQQIVAIVIIHQQRAS